MGHHLHMDSYGGCVMRHHLHMDSYVMAASWDIIHTGQLCGDCVMRHHLHMDSYVMATSGDIIYTWLKKCNFFRNEVFFETNQPKLLREKTVGEKRPVVDKSFVGSSPIYRSIKRWRLHRISSSITACCLFSILRLWLTAPSSLTPTHIISRHSKKRKAVLVSQSASHLVTQSFS